MQNVPSTCRRGIAASLLAAAVAFSAPALAQSVPEVPQLSPLARVEQRVGVTDFSVTYSSPGVKGRTIWGGLVPWDKVWRTGANAPTKLEASREFSLGGTKVPAGTYSVFTIPGKASWTVILNKDPNASEQRYDKSKDAARITVKPEKLPYKRERLTFVFSDFTDDAANLDLEWEQVRIRIPLKLDTKALTAANIQDSLKEAWRPHWVSARYLLDSNGDLKQALTYANTSIAIQPTWWNQWTKAQILETQNKKGEARAAAQEAQKLGKGEYVYENFYKQRIADAIAGWK